ncbi:NADH:flavin oxidoreductase [Paramagnetospirillum caucaseum]|uniref:NADH:flavin oxidoreductase n=1 Tax=Paramagnetospirillum caucaseum TaxID=1244869 RepID=M2Z4K1_9PROT|nr:NADH:flavin oxidoreductase [Paramagnetospirillum caucaseum]EME69290.1 NADH:flavin oxidoreductase [Paramagnetospirillum caucaseum]
MKFLEPLDLQGMVIPNRVMVPAMVTRLADEEGWVTQEIQDRYVRYAKGGVGLIVVEAMAIHHSNAGPLLRISDQKFVPGLAEMVKQIHGASDSKVVPQIIHFMKISKSGWRQTVDMLSHEDIDTIVEQFGDAVARAREAGFDGAELHAAHAYTLSSFLSRRNMRKDEYGGSMEGRLRILGRVVESVRRKAGADFPVGIRILADEFITDGSTVSDSKLIALRMAQLGLAYISLSVGGKFEDAEHAAGQVPHPYNGYSGDRCMPGAQYPAALHAGLTREIKAFLNAKGYQVPVAGAGKISDPDDAERVLADGSMDFVGIARGLLADPDWVLKVARGEIDRIVKCDYCNVCKHLDGAHKKVVCFLWPKGMMQAPDDNAQGSAPGWPNGSANLRVGLNGDTATLQWDKAEGAARYDVYRASDDGDVVIEDAVKVTRWMDNSILGGLTYRYYVRACSASGQAGAPSNVVMIKPDGPSVERDREADRAPAMA